MMAALVSLAQSGGLEGTLLTGGTANLDGAPLRSKQFYETDYTLPLLFLANGSMLEEKAETEHLLGSQWGMMNETGSYPGQAWLWLYTMWYQIEPMKSSPNADLQVMLIMAILSLLFVCIRSCRLSTASPAGSRSTG